MKNSISFKVRGRYAIFTDPLTRVGGEKCSYHIPTYEALKGIACSIYWKPTFTWVIDKVRIINPIRTESKNIKSQNYGGGNSLSIYTYLAHVEYQVMAHFEWNLFREDMKHDRIDGKHHSTAVRMIEKGGRRDVFLGARECQGYIEPCHFHEGKGHYDSTDELAFGFMFHGFDYPDSNGNQQLYSRFWRPTMKNGVIEFIPPEQCDIRKYIREMKSNPPQSVGVLEKGLFE
jgi:CRISPR-associated protein Cas5d